MDDYLRTHREIGFPGLDEADAAVPEDPLRDPTVPPSQEAVCTDAGVRPHPPFLFARLLVGRDLVDGAFPVHGARFAPQGERGDCGWIVWSGDRDLETAADDTGFDIVSVQELHERCAEAGHYLALPPAWGFTRDGLDRGEAYPIDIVD